MILNLRQLRFGPALPSLAFLMFDNMHVLDLGVTLHIIANTLFTIVLDMGKRNRRNREANFDQVWLRLSIIYKKHDIKPQLTRLRWKQVVKDPNAPFADYPSLRSVKAAEARALLKACVVLAHEHLDDSDETKFRHGLCQAMADVYMMLEGSRYTIDDYKALQQHATKVLVYYQWLAKQAMTKGFKRWSVVNKHHFLEHLVAQNEYENTAQYDCYSGEDFVGRMSRLAHMCISGKPIHALTHSFVERYRIAFQLRLSRLGHGD
jgi:hypothetical protein